MASIVVLSNRWCHTLPQPRDIKTIYETTPIMGCLSGCFVEYILPYVAKKKIYSPLIYELKKYCELHGNNNSYNGDSCPIVLNFSS